MTSTVAAPNCAKDTFSRTLRAAREKSALSVNELAERSGVNRQQLALYEAGASEPRATSLLKIARALGCSVDYLLSETAS